MPLSVFKQLGLGASRPTTVIQQLADRSYVYPERAIEDVLLQIRKFIFPTNFIIMDYEADKLVPIILGQLLLSTGDAIIKVLEGKMIMRVYKEEAVFNVYRSIHLPRHYEYLAMISVVEINEAVVDPSAFKEDALEKALMLFNHLELEEEVEEMMQILDASCEYIRERSQFEPLDRPIVPLPKPSVEEAPKLELKPLSYHLHYAYLGSSNTLPVIVSSHLSNLQEEKLLRVLREHKRAIGWTMSNIKVLARCKKTNLVLNRKKCHFIVREGIMLGHKVSKDGLEVDKAKVKAIEKLLLEKDVLFKFDDSCLKAFEELKKKLVSAPIIVAPDWNEPFELMCDASDGAIGAVLGQRKSKIFHSIYYASKTLTPAQIKYTEFDLEIRDRKGTENQVADHLSRLETRSHVAEGDVIKETFPYEQLLAITVGEVPWYANFVNYLASGEMPPDLEPHAKKKLLRDVRSYVWDEPFLFKSFTDQLMRRCVLESEINAILHDCHASPYGGHHAGDKMAAKVLQ
uniref:Reverse transcriptase/retrotransposon-derived protein RNase H-like domain-containing protein n=1 Tax=Nicotiana tabacum TaxID=4097 RepID=A0A1S3XC43_TOBAC|nr:PREDICTED: uncharacterized protein LOC107763497 [Nicotiana tabacum]